MIIQNDLNNTVELFQNNRKKYNSFIKQRLSSTSSKSIAYSFNDPIDKTNILKRIVTFPVKFVFNGIHCLVGRTFFLPTPKHTKTNKEILIKQATDPSSKWIYHPLTLKINGMKVEAMIVTTAETYNNGNWMLCGFGKGESMENRLSNIVRKKGHSPKDCGDEKFRIHLEETGRNGIFFNYPTNFSATKKMAIQAYRVVLRALCKEIKSEDIWLYNYSISGAINNHALKGESYLPKSEKIDFKKIRLNIKDRTFSRLSRVVRYYFGRSGLRLQLGKIGEKLTKATKWGLDGEDKSFTASTIPEVVLLPSKQTKDPSTRDRVANDGVIHRKASIGSSKKLNSYTRRVLLGPVKHAQKLASRFNFKDLESYVRPPV